MDELFIRQTPHSLEAEQAVLGSLLIDAYYDTDVFGMLSADDFYISVNRDIFTTIMTMFSFGHKIDPVTVLSKMNEDGVSNGDSPAYVRDLMVLTPTAANVKEYAAIVRDKSLLRALAEAGSDINAMAVAGEGGVASILEASEKRIYALRQDRNRKGLEPISAVIFKVYEQVIKASQDGAGLPGLASGFVDLDSYIMGLNKSDLILIAARPGVGKTALALNMALNVAKTSGKAVAVFSLEMSREQLALRLLSSESFIDNKKLQRGQLSKVEEWNKLTGAAGAISAVNLLINDDASLTVTSMNAQCRRINDLGLVVIDYIQLIQSASNTRGFHSENRVQAMSDISRMMKIMAKELNVPVICLSQLSRDNEKRKENKRPVMSDLRDSGSLEQDADIVIGIYRDDYYNEESEIPNITELIVLKNRRGETGTIKVLWMPEYMTFSSLDKRHAEDF